MKRVDHRRLCTIRYRRLLVWFCVFLPLAQAPPARLARAQDSSLPQTMTRVTKEPSLITIQLQMALANGRIALHALETAGHVGSLQEVARSAGDTYVLIRAARAGMELAQASQKFQDPVLDFALKRTTQAWNLARTPVDRLSWGQPREEYLQMAIRDLREAMRILEQVVTVWP